MLYFIEYNSGLCCKAVCNGTLTLTVFTMQVVSALLTYICKACNTYIYTYIDRHVNQNI